MLILLVHVVLLKCRSFSQIQLHLEAIAAAGRMSLMGASMVAGVFALRPEPTDPFRRLFDGLSKATRSPPRIQVN